ncbi:MAG: 6-carboxytetrahydropterin synthase [Nitrososphaerales archaeon]|nr:6-carboxytetrahydropterin synthase [Nitrososphaerales archaeon]
MEETLLEKLAPRLKELGTGGYSRVYRGKSGTYSTSLRLAIAEILDSLGIGFKENVKVPSTSLTADFEANGTFFFVDRELKGAEIARLGKAGKRVVLVKVSSERSDRADAGVRVVEVGSSVGERRQTIFLDDPSFNFDYAHILPHTQKCSVMHGHTSSALVEIIGTPIEGMVVDFGEAKDIIRDAIRSLDHKLFISEKYVSKDDGKSVTLSFDTVHGKFVIKAPKATTVLLDGEATVENLAREVLNRISPRMPPNASAVGVYVYEGLNKGSHLLAQLHSSGAGARRRKR